MPEWLNEALNGSQPWPLRCTKEQESMYQSELRLWEDWESLAKLTKRNVKPRVVTSQGVVVFYYH